MSPGSRCVKHMEPGLFLCRAETFYAQHHYHAGTAPGGGTFTPPTAAIFPQKCGRWHFENAVGRENPAKPRPVDSILGIHRARWQEEVNTLSCQSSKSRPETPLRHPPATFQTNGAAAVRAQVQVLCI